MRWILLPKWLAWPLAPLRPGPNDFTSVLPPYPKVRPALTVRKHCRFRTNIAVFLKLHLYVGSIIIIRRNAKTYMPKTMMRITNLIT